MILLKQVTHHIYHIIERVLWTDELFEVFWSSVPSSHDHLYTIFPATLYS